MLPLGTRATAGTHWGCQQGQRMLPSQHQVQTQRAISGQQKDRCSEDRLIRVQPRRILESGKIQQV